MINFCNTQITNSTDYAIAKAILDSVGHADDLSLEMLADRAAVSQTSVSRFIKKAGFPSFQNFRSSFGKSLEQLHMTRQMHHYRHYGALEDEALKDRLFQIALKNLTSTKEKLNISRLEMLIERMRSAKSVTFFGDDHTLAVFYPLQLDLAAAGIPAYIYKLQDIQSLHAESLGEGDVVIYLNVHSEWMTVAERAFFSKLRVHRKAYLVGFFQETDDEIESLFDEKIVYGVPASKNRGFYSLQFIQRIMAEMMYSTVIDEMDF